MNVSLVTGSVQTVSCLSFNVYIFAKPLRALIEGHSDSVLVVYMQVMHLAVGNWCMVSANSRNPDSALKLIYIVPENWRSLYFLLCLGFSWYFSFDYT